MMVNKVKEIVNRLDGYSSFGLAFAVTEIGINNGGYYLKVTPYSKDGKEVTEEQHMEELAELTYVVLQ